jgi:hypothetical protein
LVVAVFNRISKGGYWKKEASEIEIYEVIQSEYGIPFDLIEERWTDDQYFAIVDALAKRRNRENEANRRASRTGRASGGAGGGASVQKISHAEAKKMAQQRAK